MRRRLATSFPRMSRLPTPTSLRPTPKPRFARPRRRFFGRTLMVPLGMFRKCLSLENSPPSSVRNSRIAPRPSMSRLLATSRSRMSRSRLPTSPFLRPTSRLVLNRRRRKSFCRNPMATHPTLSCTKMRPTWTRVPARIRWPLMKMTRSAPRLRLVLLISRRSRERAFPRLRGWRIMSSAQSSRRGIRVSHSMLPPSPGPPSLPTLPSRKPKAFDPRPPVRSSRRPARLTTHRLFPGEGSGRVSDPPRWAGLRGRDLRGAWSVPARTLGFPPASVGARAGESDRIGWSAERSHPVRPQSVEPFLASRRGAAFERAIDQSGRSASRSPAPFRFRKG